MRQENNMIRGLESIILPQIVTDIDDDLPEKIDDPIVAAEQEKDALRCDLCGQDLQDDCICNTEAAVCLCDQCFHHLGKIT